MRTLSFHAPVAASRKIRAAARRRGQPVSSFLREAAESAATVDAGNPFGGLEHVFGAVNLTVRPGTTRDKIRARLQNKHRR